MNPSPDLNESARSSPKDTKERLLDAAEILFADHGFSDASLRGITGEAQVNLAAVNYHFGSKEELFRAVLKRTLEPMNDERLRLLDETLRRDPKDLNGILRAFVGPPLRLQRERGPRGADFLRLLGHAQSDPTTKVRDMVIEQFREVFERFSGALMQALPHLPPDEVIWRMIFFVGSMAHTMALSSDIRRLTQGQLPDDDTEAAVARLIRFIRGGLEGSS